MQALSANLLTPPDGEVTDIASLQQTMRVWVTENGAVIEKVNLIIGFGHDNSQMAGLRHPTRQELDAISTEVPIYIVHQSGRLGTANTKALEIAGITADTPNPSRRVIVRDGFGDATGGPGVLEENAHYSVLVKSMGRVDAEGIKTIVKSVAELWARYGYTTATEGRLTKATAAIMTAVAGEGGFKIDVLSHTEVMDDRDYIIANASREYVNRYRLRGAKLSIDSFAPRLHGAAGPALLRPGGELPARLPRLCRAADGQGDGSDRLSLCQGTPDPDPFQW